MAMRIRLVEPRPAGHNVYDFAMLPRLGLPLIATMLGAAGHDAHSYCELLGPVDLGDLLDADLVGISSTTSTAPSAYRLADMLGEAGVPVVLGGPHVTFQPQEALEHAPYVVRGEGERTICELVERLESGDSLTDVAGLSFRGSDDVARHNPPRTRCSQEQFEALPIPNLRLIAGHERMHTKPLMTQWGCPYDCEFCSVTAMFTRVVRHRRGDQVLAELAGLGAERVFFYDDNFVVKKARTAELLRSMLAADLTPYWFAQVRADVVLRSHKGAEIDHEFLELMRRSGCVMVMIGIEAVTEAGLTQIRKRLSVATIEAAINAFHRHGIAVHGMFVAGLDTDELGAAQATAAFARRLGIDTFQLMVETPLPGTRLYERAAADGRLLSDDWSLFDGHHVVMRPARTTALELQLDVLEAMRRFYAWPSIISSGIASALGHLPDLTALARPALLRRLPTIAGLAHARRFDEVLAVVRDVTPARVLARARAALWLPATRIYARRQLAAWSTQERSAAHLHYLASLG